MAQLTFYPSLTDPVDGHMSREVVSPGETWATLKAGAGTHANYTLDYLNCAFLSLALTDKWWVLWRAIIMFDTSSIPDGVTITAATLSIYGYAKQDYNNNLPTVNIYGATPAGTDQLVAADFGQCLAVAFCDAPIAYANWTTTGWNDFAFNAAGIAAINKTGISKFSLRFAKYDVGSETPSWAVEANTSMAGRSRDAGLSLSPKLVVTYTTIVVVTDPATDITTTGATLNGTLTDDGGAACTCSFEYGLTPAYGSTATATGTYTSGQTFLKAITGLTPGTLYHFRAKANNGGDVGYGSDLTFTTLPAPKSFATIIG